MSDAVSKLYAEIGFKVNQDGLKQAQRFLKSLHTQMSNLNKQTKEMAKQYGIFSKQENAQRREDEKQKREEVKTERERIKNQMVIRNQEFNEKIKQQKEDTKIENERTKGKILLRKQEFNENLKLKKEEESQKRREEKDRRQQEKEAKREADRAAKEQQRAEEKQAKESEKAAKEQQKRLKNILGGFRSFAVGLRNTFLGLTGVGGLGITAGIAQSVGRSIPTRNFLMSTGVELGQLQQVMQRMVNTGSALSQQQVMADIQKVSQNLKDISLGGGDIVPYKLAGIAAQGDVMGVIRATEQAVKSLDNAMALNLTRRIGLSDDWLASWRFKERYGGDQVQLSQEQQKEIANAKVALGQLVYGFKLLADQITAVLSPTIEEISDLMRDSFQGFARYLKENSEEFRQKIKEIVKTITDYIKEINWGEIWNNIKSVGSAMGEFANIIHKLASIFGIAEDEKEKEPMYAAEKHWWGTKMKPILEYRPSTVGKAVNSSLSPDTLKMVSNFSSSPNKMGLINAIDNHVNNITINGVAQEEIAEKAKEAVEEANKKEETIMQKKLYGASDLWVVAPTIAG